jgi:hypothetical protein
MLFLRSDVHAVALQEDVVFLDVSADAYICVPQGAALLGLAKDGLRLCPSQPGVGGSLIAAGLAVRDMPPIGDRYRSPPPLPASGLPRAIAPRLSPLDAANLLGALLDLVLHYRGHTFAAILAYVERARQRRPPTARAPDVLDLARRFQAGAIWLPAPGKCLVRSFLLLRFLQRSNCDAEWVFGVHTWPFEAHCWLQSGDIVLDDAPERLLRYQPICAV